MKSAQNQGIKNTSSTKSTGVIVGALSLRNPYDGHTLEAALKQHETLTGTRAATAVADRGYKGKKRLTAPTS